MKYLSILSVNHRIELIKFKKKTHSTQMYLIYHDLIKVKNIVPCLAYIVLVQEKNSQHQNKSHLS